MTLTAPLPAVVVPTVRPDQINRFLDAWRPSFMGRSRVIVVQDAPERTFDAPDWVEAYSHEDIDRDLGADAWVIPRRTDCVRSYGFLLAARGGAPAVLTLDDDCAPAGHDSWLDEHLCRLSKAVDVDAWTSTITGGWPRGFPYLSSRRRLTPAMNHGAWTGVLDWDAPTQLQLERAGRAGAPEVSPSAVDGAVEPGRYFPMCGMNVAVEGAALPAFYFLLMGTLRGGDALPFDRFGDIWCGVVFKKIADHLGRAVVTGRPAVRHTRASNVWRNLVKEAPGLEANEAFWLEVDAVRLSGDTWASCYREVADAVGRSSLPGGASYWSRVGRAMRTWTDLIGAARTP